MANVAEISIGATKATGWAAAESGRLALRAGAGFLQRVQPGYVPPEIETQQEALRRLEGRFGVVDLDPEMPEGDLQDMARVKADALAEQGLADEDIFVEFRDVVPAEKLWIPGQTERRHKIAKRMKEELEDEYNIMSGVTNSQPLTPSVREDSPPDIRTTWGILASEADVVWHHMHGRELKDHPRVEPAFVIISPPEYERVMFGGHIAVLNEEGDIDERSEESFLALESVGKLPEDNKLVLH